MRTNFRVVNGKAVRITKQNRYSKRNINKRLANENTPRIEKFKNYKGAIGALAKAVSNITKTGYPEKKNRDAYNGFSATCSPLASGGLLLSGILQGTTSITRIGDKVKGDNLFIRTLWQMGSANTTQSNIRYWVILDKEQPKSTLGPPAYTDIFQNAAAVTTFMNLENSDRFAVLKTRSFQLDRNGKSSIQFMDKIPVNFTMSYVGPLGQISDCKENMIYIYWVSDDGTNTGQPTDITLSSRLTFYDN